MEYESLYQSLKHECLECTVVGETEGEEVEGCAVFKFNDKYVGFDGHFPGRPILPAIVQLAAVRYVAERLLDERLYPESYRRAKFRGMVQPEEIIELHLQLKNKDHKWTGLFSLQKRVGIELDTIATGNCVFIPVTKMRDKI